MTREAIAIDAELALREGADSRAPGGEVTVALCGSWEHEGPCRWPHYSRIDADTRPAHLRSVVVVPDDERDEIVRRIEAALRGDERWSVERFSAGPIAAEEHDLAIRLGRAEST